MTQHESTPGKWALGWPKHGGDSPCGWVVVVVLCNPQLFIICCSIKQAWRQLPPGNMHTAHDRLCDLAFMLLFIHNVSFVGVWSPSPSVLLFFHLDVLLMHHLSVSASLLLSCTIFIPSFPLHLFLWIQYPQMMRGWFSWVWPIAQIRVRQNLSVLHLNTEASNATEAVHIALCSLWGKKSADE